MSTTMLIQTTAGMHDARTHNLESSDPKAVVEFLKKGGLTAGFSISFAVNKATGQVVRIMKGGHLCQRDIKPLLEKGFTEFLFSWAFSGKNFRLETGAVVQAKTLDLVTREDLHPWRSAFGQ